MDALGAAFSSLLEIYLVYFANTSEIGASSTGFSLNMAGTYADDDFISRFSHQSPSRIQRHDPILGAHDEHR